MAELELEATVTASDSPGTLQYEKQLLSFPIPGAGISVTGIFSLGATLSYNVGFTSTIQGTATVDFGLSASIPNTAALTADIKNPDSSSATGFSGGSLIPLFDVKDLSASITLGAYSKPQLSFGVKLVEIGTTDVDISVKLPEVDVTLTAAYSTYLRSPISQLDPTDQKQIKPESAMAVPSRQVSVSTAATTLRSTSTSKPNSAILRRHPGPRPSLLSPSPLPRSVSLFKFQAYHQAKPPSQQQHPRSRSYQSRLPPPTYTRPPAGY